MVTTLFHHKKRFLFPDYLFFRGGVKEQKRSKILDANA